MTLARLASYWRALFTWTAFVAIPIVPTIITCVGSPGMFEISNMVSALKSVGYASFRRKRVLLYGACAVDACVPIAKSANAAATSDKLF